VPRNSVAARSRNWRSTASSNVTRVSAETCHVNETKKTSPHALRHTYAIRCLRAGASVVAVSKLLGHAGIATTQRYVDHLATEELRASVPALPIGPTGAIEAAPPRCGFGQRDSP
jgi:site-specific recombinase XerD